MKPILKFICVVLLLFKSQLGAADDSKSIVPLVDYHQHLMSPAGADLVNRFLPAIEVPQELAQLLKERGRAWNDKAALAELFVEDCVAHSLEAPWWLHGRDEVVSYLSQRFAGEYRLTPVAYKIEKGTAQVSGYLTRVDGGKSKHFGDFYLGLQKDQSNQWRITSEVDSRIPLDPPVSAETLISLLDDAEIKRAVVLSDGYWFDGRDNPDDPDPFPKVKAENDWTAEQVAKYPDRLIAFCSFNPLRPYALEELQRCAKSGKFRGLKLHFNTSEVDLKNPEHLEKVKAVYKTANELRFPIIVHLRTGSTYGGEDVKIFLSQIVAAAPDIPIHVAHLWGGEGFSDSALAAFGEAFDAKDPHTNNLYFDVAQIALVARGSSEILQTCAKRMRQFGMKRILYGSDGPEFGNLSPREAWRQFRKDLSLTEEEFRTIANNVAPYLSKP